MFVETLEKKNQYLGGHVVLFMNGVYLNVIYVRSTSEWGLQSGDYLKGHMKAVHEGMALQCTICTINYILYWWS